MDEEPRWGIKVTLSRWGLSHAEMHKACGKILQHLAEGLEG